MSKNAKSILFVDQYSQMGGGQTVLLELIESCLDADWSISLLAPAGGNLESTVKSRFGNRVNFVSLHEMKLAAGKKSAMDILRLVIGSLSLFKHLSLIRAHAVVHTNGARYFPIIGFLSMFIKSRFFYHVHLDHSRYEKGIISWLARQRNCAGVFVNSKFVLERLRLVSGIAIDQLILLRFGLSKTLSARAYTNRFENSPANHRTVVIGRLSEEKGQDLIVSAALSLQSMQFNIVGSSDFQRPKFAEELRARAPKNVAFAGRSENVPKSVDDFGAGFSVVPSRWEEPFGLTAIESMAMSLVTITSGRGGLKEIAEETNSVVFSNDADLTNHLKRLSQIAQDELFKLSFDQYTRTQAAFGWPTFSETYQQSLCRRELSL